MLIYLKTFREKYNLTQQEASDAMEIDRRQWSRYEQGTNEFPLRYLVALCKHYNVSSDWLLGLDEGAEVDEGTQSG